MSENIMHPSPGDIILSGKRLRVRTGGTGPALLLLHSAWGDAALSWSSVWNDFCGGFSVIAPDLPGFGASEPLDNPSLTANARVLEGLLDALKISNAIVVGNSFGVAVAIEFASLFPGRTRHLVAVNGGYLPTFPGFVKKLFTLGVLEQPFRKFFRNVSYSDKAFAKAFPEPTALPPHFIDQIRRHEERQSRVVFDTFMGQTKPQTPPPVPATVIWGTGDRLVTMKQAGILRRWLGNPDFIPIDGAGHLPQVERPAAFGAAMSAMK